MRGSPSHSTIAGEGPSGSVLQSETGRQRRALCAGLSKHSSLYYVFVGFFPSLVSDFFKIEIFFSQVSDDTSLKLVPPEASRGYNNKETQCSFKRENLF